jgi:hypothetical protein
VTPPRFRGFTMVSPSPWIWLVWAALFAAIAALVIELIMFGPRWF